MTAAPSSSTAPKRATERVAVLGPNKLIGIETLAAGPPSAAGLPAVILLNAGVVHRVGPHRVTVNLARRLAEAGHAVLRFDQAGVGDSRPRAAGVSYLESVIDDVRQAMNHLEKATGARRFILGGICSGADNSLRAALVEPRVAGIALLDPYAYRTAGYYLRQAMTRGRHLGPWKRLAGRGLSRLGEAVLRRVRGPSEERQVPASLPQVPQYSRKFPPREEFADALRTLVDRGTEVLIVYTGSLSRVYNHADQFDEAFRPYGLVPRVRCLYVPELNHTFTERKAQEVLAGTLVGWAERMRAPRVA